MTEQLRDVVATSLINADIEINMRRFREGNNSASMSPYIDAVGYLKHYRDTKTGQWEDYLVKADAVIAIVVERCAQVAADRAQVWTGRERGPCSQSLLEECEDIAAAIRALQEQNKESR